MKLFAIVFFVSSLSGLRAFVPQDDLPTRVRALIEKVAAEDIGVADDAAAQLAALGPPALDTIRRERDRSSGDLKTRLDGVITSIETAERIRKATQTPGPITLKADAKPLADVLAELKKASGQPLAFKDLPEGTVTVDIRNAPFWEALDTICKAHGGILWFIQDAEIRIAKSPWRDRPKIVKGNLVFFLDRFVWEHLPGGFQEERLTLTTIVGWTAGARPAQVIATFDSISDNEGNELTTPHSSFDLLYWTAPIRGRNALSAGLRPRMTRPAETATTLSVKGRVFAKYVFARQRVLTVPGPKMTEHDQPLAAGKYSVAVVRVAVDRRDVRIDVLVSWQGRLDAFAREAAEWRIVDDRGRSIEADVLFTSSSCGSDHNSIGCAISATLPEGSSAAALELWTASDAAELEIPFDFKELKIR